MSRTDVARTELSRTTFWKTEKSRTLSSLVEPHSNRAAHLSTLKNFKKRRKGKKSYNTQYSRVVPHHSTDWASSSLTSEIGRVPVYSRVYGRSQQSLPKTILYPCYYYNQKILNSQNEPRQTIEPHTLQIQTQKHRPALHLPSKKILERMEKTDSIFWKKKRKKIVL